jgi:serine/threonine protein kinase
MMGRNRIGQQIGNYHVMKLLAPGGSTVTYLGEHIHLHTQAAIKVLNLFDFDRIRDQKDLFSTEARLLVSLSHPHIIRVLDFGIEDEFAFLIVEYASNGTVAERHHRSGLSFPLAVSYLKQVASALEHAHARGIVHGAITPHDMLLGRNDELLLSGFHLRLISNLTMGTGMHQVLGTPVYVAPELIQGGYPTPATDQYTLATVVYEWLSGVRPFEGESTMNLMIQHLQAPVPPLHRRMPTLPSEVDKVLIKALAKDPKDRFAHVQDFADALEVVYRQHTSLSPASSKAPAIKVFFSYSSKDGILRDELETQLSLLKRQGLISSWHDRQISAGEEWAAQIDEHLNTAHIILLLVSANFIASDYCYNIEMRRAMERHAKGEAKVIPILLRPVDRKNTPFEKLQVLPRNGKPITSWQNIDEAFFEVAQGIREAIEELTKSSS